MVTDARKSLDMLGIEIWENGEAMKMKKKEEQQKLDKVYAVPQESKNLDEGERKAQG